MYSDKKKRKVKKARKVKKIRSIIHTGIYGAKYIMKRSKVTGLLYKKYLKKNSIPYVRGGGNCHGGSAHVLTSPVPGY